MLKNLNTIIGFFFKYAVHLALSLFIVNLFHFSNELLYVLSHLIIFVVSKKSIDPFDNIVKLKVEVDKRYVNLYRLTFKGMTQIIGLIIFGLLYYPYLLFLTHFSQFQLIEYKYFILLFVFAFIFYEFSTAANKLLNVMEITQK